MFNNLTNLLNIIYLFILIIQFSILLFNFLKFNKYFILLINFAILFKYLNY